jgi:hypothetical protein
MILFTMVKDRRGIVLLMALHTPYMVILRIHSPLMFMAGIGIPNLEPLQLHGILKMFKVREVVEWGLANIRSNWSFLDFRAAMMVIKSPIA